MSAPYDDRRAREGVQQSENSPSIVDSSENLLRAMFTPEHIDDKGHLKEQAIPSQDLSERGFSVQREQYTNDTLNQKIVSGWLNNKPEREFIKLGKISCLHTRNINDQQNNQAFVVLDDAIEENPAHAIILTAEKYGKGALEKLRHELIEAFNQD